ncbi:DNA polymerase III subunit chi [Candidatus Bodocaedibacter vickermanii]|uniref:DNA polymerase III subunit chi n=1 Tax=Candidatus Bodocaedibacter vickermanii TaxID=2741701 RepID=A0A7L9RSJ3_9PROT|nr:DNA polymerase III subunit chi [Candidatus Paracaedibacteraceae bacterium 'Lake Konstanz']
MQIVGYHHSISPLEKVLPKLLEKVLAAGQRAVVMAPSEDQLKIIDTFLWTYSKSELLPHGTADDGNPSYQPIWLTCTDENPNGAQVLVLIDAVRPTNLSQFEKVLILDSAWSNESTQWAQSIGDLTVWEEQVQGGWQRAVASIR